MSSSSSQDTFLAVPALGAAAAAFGGPTDVGGGIFFVGAGIGGFTESSRVEVLTGAGAVLAGDFSAGLAVAVDLFNSASRSKSSSISP